MFTNPNEHTYTITLLRHGQSTANAEGYHQGQHDFPLSELGLRQAQALASRWLAEGAVFDHLIASPLARARQTAEIIAETLGLAVEFDPDWMERDNGVLAGLKYEVAAELHPRPPFIHPYQRIGRTGESQWELYLRAGRALSNLLYRPAGRYLVVSHGGLLNMVLYAALGIAPQANFQGPGFAFDNTSFAVLRYRPDVHDWLFLSFNDRQHFITSEQISKVTNGQYSK
jgi:2,3-bisphosphoglycerate-dependent phosphoglycerate mutase